MPPSAVRRLAVAAAVLSAGGGLLAPPATAGPEPTANWIVVLKDHVPGPGAVAAQHREAHGAQVRHVWSSALNGYAARLTARGQAAVRADPRVAHVERDGVVRAAATQSSPPWGLDRIGERSLPLSVTYTYTATGTGVTAYVLDTGIRLGHGEFGGRVASGANTAGDGMSGDCNGHGTHVAGTLGGARHGVAKKVRLVAVRVLDCDAYGSTSALLAGVDWVTAHARKPAVANMSINSSASTALDSAVKRSISAGITWVVAAGNGDGVTAQDACTSSPARVPAAITVGATDKADRKTPWSNYGACVDVFAPGNGITSAWGTGDSATRTLNGTSMATAHAAGVAALHLQARPAATPQQVRDALFAASTKRIVTSARSANNHLLYTSS